MGNNISGDYRHSISEAIRFMLDIIWKFEVILTCIVVNMWK